MPSCFLLELDKKASTKLTSFVAYSVKCSFVMNNVPFPFTSYHSRRQRVHNRQLQRNYLSSLSLIHNHFKWTTKRPCPPSGDRMTSPSVSSSSFLHRFPVSRFLSLHPFRTTAHDMANAWRINSSETNSGLPNADFNPILDLNQEGDVNENDESVPGKGSHPSMKLDTREKMDGCPSRKPSVTGFQNVNFCHCRYTPRKEGDDNGDMDEDLVSCQDELFYEGGRAAKQWNSRHQPQYPTFSDGPWLEVPSELGFTLDSAAQSFIGRATLRNTSPGYISFSVMPTTPNVFSLSSRTGLLPPGHRLEVVIATKSNLSKDPQIVEVLLRSGFYVLATPIYFSSQLSQKKVRILWKAFGSRLFPVEAAECHLIKRMVLWDSDRDALGDYNLIEQAVIGNYTALVKKLPSLKTMLKRRQRQLELRGEELGMEESDYVKSWMPSEVGPEQERFLKAHYQQLTKSVTRLREDMDAAATITRMSGFTLLAFALAFFILRYITILQDFGANGVWVKDARNKYPK